MEGSGQGLERLTKHPKLLERMNRLLDIVDNADGRATRADDAEACVIVEMRSLGREVLEEWATDEKARQEAAIEGSGVKVRKKTKKTLLAQHVWVDWGRRICLLSKVSEEDDSRLWDIRWGSVSGVFVSASTGHYRFWGGPCLWPG
jgi:hypothetical protein